MRELTTEQTESVKEHLFNKLGVCLYDTKNKRHKDIEAESDEEAIEKARQVERDEGSRIVRYHAQKNNPHLKRTK